MGFGFSKDFILFSFISVLVGIGTGNWKSGLSIFLVYSACKIVYKILS